MLQNADLVAKIGADTAENERHFAENLPKIGNYPTVMSSAGGTARPAGAERRAGLARKNGWLPVAAIRR